MYDFNFYDSVIHTIVIAYNSLDVTESEKCFLLKEKYVCVGILIMIKNLLETKKTTFGVFML